MEPTRVNIQYSIDLEELPNEVERLLYKATNSLEEAVDQGDILEEREDLLTVATLNKINDLRMCLTRTDLILEDMVKIVGGYLKMNMDATAQPTQSSQQHQAQHHGEVPETAQNRPLPAMERPFRPPTPDFIKLQEKLQQFADSLPDEDAPEVPTE